MPRSDDPNDPRGLIQESFRIDGIDLGQCRTVFLDWALGHGAPYDDALVALLARYADQPEDHPMKATLRAALAKPPATGRRGGRAARVTD
ncbi:MAG: hypothetical protein KC448_13790 [Yoonia sp.]|nr:hypothetical protein [Yoonia sp.]